MVPAASVAARCEPVPAFPLIPDPSTCPAWSLRHPSLPGVSRFRRIGSYLRRVTRAPGPVLWQRTPGACAERGLVRTRSHQAEPPKPEGRSGAHGHRGLWFCKGRLQSKLKEVADFVRPNDVLPEKSSFEGDLSGRKSFQRRKSSASSNPARAGFRRPNTC